MRQPSPFPAFCFHGYLAVIFRVGTARRHSNGQLATAMFMMPRICVESIHCNEHGRFFNAWLAESYWWLVVLKHSAIKQWSNDRYRYELDVQYLMCENKHWKRWMGKTRALCERWSAVWIKLNVSRFGPTIACLAAKNCTFAKQKCDRWEWFMPKNDKSMYISLAFMPVAPVQNVSIAFRAYMMGSGTSIEAEQQKAETKKKKNIQTSSAAAAAAAAVNDGSNAA